MTMPGLCMTRLGKLDPTMKADLGKDGQLQCPLVVEVAGRWLMARVVMAGNES